MEENSLKNSIVSQISQLDVPVRSQQRGEPDLCSDEKWLLLSELLESRPGHFLNRFSRFLSEEQLRYFDKFSEEYEVSYYLKEARRIFHSSTGNILIKNRRYDALKRLVENGEYFSEEEMKKRNPLLYESLIGQYQTEEEKEGLDKIDMSNCSFVNILMSHIDRDEISSRRHQQQAEEEAAYEEEEESDDESGENFDVTMKKNITQEEKEVLKEEFVSTMYRTFLEGKDPEFDYAMVDYNAEYDNLEIRARDEEEAYFDED